VLETQNKNKKWNMCVYHLHHENSKQAQRCLSTCLAVTFFPRSLWLTSVWSEHYILHKTVSVLSLQCSVHPANAMFIKEWLNSVCKQHAFGKTRHSFTDMFVSHYSWSSHIPWMLEVLHVIRLSVYMYIKKGKGKVIPLQPRCGPEGG